MVSVADKVRLNKVRFLVTLAGDGFDSQYRHPKFITEWQVCYLRMEIYEKSLC